MGPSYLIRWTNGNFSFSQNETNTDLWIAYWKHIMKFTADTSSREGNTCAYPNDTCFHPHMRPNKRHDSSIVAVRNCARLLHDARLSHFKGKFGICAFFPGGGVASCYAPRAMPTRVALTQIRVRTERVQANQIQWSAVTVTPSGISKSVTVTDCHCNSS